MTSDTTSSARSVAGCPLCGQAAATASARVWGDDDLHVIRVEEPGLPCYFRLIWNDHVAEMTDLSEDGCAKVWRALTVLENTVRETVAPAKINLASFGNQVPHLHWHLIGRWPDDPLFPGSAWSAPQRPLDIDADAARRARVTEAVPALRAALRAAFAGDA